MKLDGLARAGLLLALIPIALYLFVFVFPAIFRSVPYVTIRDGQPPAAAGPDIVRLLQEHIYPHSELCDPLPCWIRFDIKGIAVLDEPRGMLNNADGVVRSDQIPVIEATNRPVSGDPLTCPAGSTVVSGTIRRQWWSFAGPAPNQLEGAELVFCIEASVS